jgi:hypothetical protein
VSGAAILAPQYSALQALCDALGHAAQLEMSQAIERGDDLARERAYGKWLGLRAILRAVEARSDEWTPAERDMLELIDWETQRFNFPGVEVFHGALREPGMSS